MATGNLTADAIKALKPATKDQFVWDVKLSGFGLKVTPAGNKVYLVQYRMGGRGSPTQRFTIGTHGSPWTPKQAREEAERLLMRVRQGVDPLKEKAERERQRLLASRSTFEGLAEQFMTGYLRKKWKKSYPLAERILRGRAIPALKSRPIAAITKSDVQGVIDAIPEEQAGARRNAYAVLNLFFNWAVADDDIPIEKSPLAKLDPPDAPDEREHVLTDWELRLAWISAGSLGYPFGPVYRLLIGTGQRREEVAGLDWRELNRAAAEWKLPSERAKNGVANTIHLTPLMIAELDTIADGQKWPRRGFVFTTTDETSVSGYSRAKRRLDKAMLKLAHDEARAAGDEAEAVEIEPFRTHDFRRTMATGMQRLGFRWEVIEARENRISGQSKKGAGKIYQRHDWGPEKRTAWEAWSRRIQELVNGVDETNVVALAARRA